MSQPPRVDLITTRAKANSLIIRYPRFVHIHRLIQRCQEQSKIAGEAQCMALQGVRGAGKSTLLQEYVRLHDRSETEHGTIIPAIYVETPSPTSVKGLSLIHI